MRLKNKIAIVSGGAGGIGGSSARLMAAEGATVVITDMVDGEALAAEIGGRFYQHDVTDQAAWGRIVSEVHDAFGGIDILVNAAGTEGNIQDGTPLGSFAEWKRVLGINLDGTYLGIQAVLPMMMESGRGSIINLSSLVTYLSTPFSAPYGASKAAVCHLTKSVAAFAGLSGHRIRCNSVHPGLIRTRMTDTIFNAIGAQMGTDSEAAEQSALRHVPFGVRGTPDDVGNLIVYLASDESSYVTGSEFKVDGGWGLGVMR